MLVDQAIAMFEDSVANSDAGDVDLTEVKQLLSCVEEAPAYDVGGVDALLRDLMDKGHFLSFMEEAEQHPGTTQTLYEIGKLIWMEGFLRTASPYGFLVQFDPSRQRTFLYFVDVTHRACATFVCSDADNIWRNQKTGQPISAKVTYIVEILLATAYLASEPKTQLVTIQEQRTEKRNKRGTKVVKPRRKLVRMIVIDGVNREKVNGIVTYTVHPRGWHCRRHKVTEHLRHLESGKVVTVRAHERGNAALGCVPWFHGTSYFQSTPKRYKVQPDQTFYSTGKSETASPKV